MNIFGASTCAVVVILLCANAGGEAPPTNMMEQARWARETKDLSKRIERLEAFMREYMPSEEGGMNSEMKGYSDGSHVLAVAGCAWQLARTYVEAGQKDKALKILDWLQAHDSKSDLFPRKTKSQQAAASDGDEPSN